MKKNLLFALLCTLILTSCDERKTVESLTPVFVPVTKSKTELISRKWFVTEIYYNIDGKK